MGGIHGAFSEAEYLVRQAREMATAGDHTTAIRYLNRAISTNPQSAEAYALLGNCQDCLGQNEDAIASYTRALSIDPYHADAWFNKGMSLKKAGQPKEALQCIEKSIDLYCRWQLISEIHHAFDSTGQLTRDRGWKSTCFSFVYFLLWHV